MDLRHNSNVAGRETRAFSLIELIVAIAIISVLAALLLPTLGHSKASARSAACLSNLHQIGLALQIYVDESENHLPLMFDAPLGTNASQTNALLPTVDKVLTFYLSSTNVLRCPSDDRALFAQTGSSYAWNTLLNGQDADRLRVFEIFFDPHLIPVFFDKQAFHREKGEGRGVNYLYADGHIKNLLATVSPRRQLPEMIKLERLSKRFGSRLAVDDLTLDVAPSEIYGLLGHNGAGKSTAIGMILGQVWPTAGSAKVCGHDVSLDRRRALQQVGAIFESPQFYDYLSGWRNLEILATYTAPTSKQRMREVIEWVGLTGRERSIVKTYSHGMRARLALAQALLPNPKLLILDEPSDGLDPEGIHEMRLTVRRLHKELGLTILFSSHLLNEVEQLCTRIAVLSQGRKVFEGTIAEARSPKIWVHLQTNNFPRATQLLSDAALIVEHRDGNLIRLSPNTSTPEIVRKLVAEGMDIHAISVEEQTLESFYLELMKNASTARASVISP